MFKSTKYFVENNLPLANFSFNLYIPKEVLDEDLSNINEEELLHFCENLIPNMVKQHKFSNKKRKFKSFVVYYYQGVLYETNR